MNQNHTNDVADVGIAGVTVVITNITGTFSNSTVTDANGSFSLEIPDFNPALQATNPLAQLYVESVVPFTLPPDSTIFLPLFEPNPTVQGPVYLIQLFPELTFLYNTRKAPAAPTNVFLILSPFCSSSSNCGLSGGGTIAPNHKRPQHTFGGHVSPVPMPDGTREGEWTHIAHTLKLQFHVTEIQGVACFTVSEGPPSSAVNTIEFFGLGVLKGIGGRKANFNPVHFVIRAEDHGRPGRGKDRYYIRVFTPDNATLLIVSSDPAIPEAILPVPITAGNLTVTTGPTP